MGHTVFMLQLHHTCLYLVKHSPDGTTTDSDNSRLIAAYYSFIDPNLEIHHNLEIYSVPITFTAIGEWLSWPCWLAYSRRFTHINGYPSCPVQASESSAVRDRRSTTELHRQMILDGR